jgi:abequosyltransferase
MYELAICFSTKNRTSNLLNTLKRLLLNKNIKNEKIQITIVDATEFSSYQKIKNLNLKQKNYYINYIHDPEDLGGLDAAYDKAVRFSDAKYVYLASDDDLISENFLTVVLDKIKNNKDLYILNTNVVDSDLNMTLQENRLKVSNDYEFTYYKKKKIPNVLIEQLSYIGSILIRRENWISYDSSKYFNSYFSHLSNIFDSKDEINIYIISSVLVHCRIDAESWSKKHLILWNFYWPQFKKMITNGFSELDKSELIINISIKTLIKYYALGILDEIDNIKMSKKLKRKINFIKFFNKKMIAYVSLIHSVIKKNYILKYRLIKRLT